MGGYRVYLKWAKKCTASLDQSWSQHKHHVTCMYIYIYILHTLRCVYAFFYSRSLITFLALLSLARQLWTTGDDRPNWAHLPLQSRANVWGLTQANNAEGFGQHHFWWNSSCKALSMVLYLYFRHYPWSLVTLTIITIICTCLHLEILTLAGHIPLLYPSPAILTVSNFNPTDPLPLNPNLRWAMRRLLQPFRGGTCTLMWLPLSSPRSGFRYMSNSTARPGRWTNTQASTT